LIEFMEQDTLVLPEPQAGEVLLRDTFSIRITIAV
jgi:hypothetical protein